jgi:hypothetical protein
MWKIATPPPTMKSPPAYCATMDVDLTGVGVEDGMVDEDGGCCFGV